MSEENLKEALDTIKDMDLESLSDDDLEDVAGGGSFTCSVFKCTIKPSSEVESA